MANTSAPLVKLERTIAARARKPNPKSYTSQLLAGGIRAIGAKIVEEAGEVVAAAGEAGEPGREHFLREVGDLVYHLLVMLQLKDYTLHDVEAELSRRFGVSGLEEKAARTDLAKKAPSATANSKPVKKKVAKKVAPAAIVPVKKKAKRKSRL